MITITLQLDVDYDSLGLSEDDILDAIEDVFNRGDVTPIESVSAEVINLEWD